MAQNLAIETLTRASLEENVALARSVGWPDDAADWGVIHETALVLGVRREGRLIGQGALVSYPPNAGTIAKMNVGPDAQRQGIGAAILDALIAAADARGITCLGLIATPFGQALYASRGFEVTGEVAIFMGEPKSAQRVSFYPPQGEIDAVVAGERAFITCDRSAMLRGRFREANARAVLARADGTLRGFALATPKPAALQTMLGPIIADGEAAARELVLAVFAQISGEVRIDVPTTHASFRAWLAEIGLPEKGVRPEMARGGTLPWRVPQRFALSTAAWG